MKTHTLLQFAVLAGALAGVPSFGQSVVLDINQSAPANPSSQPRGLVSTGAWALFAATDAMHGTEPWITDGTATGTRLLLDVAPGVPGSAPDGFLGLPNGTTVFHANGRQGRELYVVDGAGAGATLVLDARPGAGDAVVTNPVLFAGAGFYFADNGHTGPELWRTDGTAAGTRLVHEFVPGPQGSFTPVFPGALAVAGSTLFAVVRSDVGSGWALYGSDGTSEGTSFLTELGASGLETVEHMASLGGTLFLGAGSPNAGRELWVSDGTKSGTAVLDLNPVADSAPEDFVAFGGHVYFAATHATFGREIFRSDGTPAGTGLFADIEPETFPLFSSSSPDLLGVAGGKLYLSAATIAGGRQLYVSDGTLAGSHVISAPVSLGNSLIDEVGVAAGQDFVFVGYLGAMPDELWRTDGTAAGTVRITDLNFGSSPSNPGGLVLLDSGAIVFSGDDGVTGQEPWATDGSVGGEFPLGDLSSLATNFGSEPQGVTEVGERVFFTAIDGNVGRELWVSDGTAQGTQLVVDLIPGAGGATLALGAELNGKLILMANDGVSGMEPWVSDGTAAGTFRLADLSPGVNSSNWNFPEHAVIGDRLYFTAYHFMYGYELFVTDGTTHGTELALDTIIGGGSGLPEGLKAIGDDLYFARRDTSFVLSHWRFDTLTGVAESLGATNPSGDSTSGVVSWAALPAGVVFAANDGVLGRELWIDPVGPVGPQMLRDILFGATGSNPADFVELGCRALFSAANVGGGRDLWSSDGTPAGTLLLATNQSVLRSAWVVTADVAFVWCVDVVGQDSLYVTDGTPGGTSIVLSTASQGSFSKELAPVGSGNLVVFQNFDQHSGNEAWVSDGTPAGTARVADSWPGAEGTNPEQFVRAANGALFVGTSPSAGQELMRFEIAELGGFVAEPFGHGCVGSNGGAPTLLTLGEPSASTMFGLAVIDGAPNAPGFLFYGFERADIQFAGCTIYPLLSIPAIPIFCNSVGSTQLPVALTPDLLGRSIYLQAFLVDPGASILGLASASAGLELVIGE